MNVQQIRARRNLCRALAVMCDRGGCRYRKRAVWLRDQAVVLDKKLYDLGGLAYPRTPLPEVK